MSKKKLTNFIISVKIILDTDFSITAENFEQALLKAAEVKVTDVVEFEGNHNDSSIDITGVFK